MLAGASVCLWLIFDIELQSDHWGPAVFPPTKPSNASLYILASGGCEVDVESLEVLELGQRKRRLRPRTVRERRVGKAHPRMHSVSFFVFFLSFFFFHFLIVSL